MPTHSENPLGFYLGGAIGRADVRMVGSLTATANNIEESDTGWKAIAGIRPLPIVGAEVEYLNFGSPHYSGAPSGGPTATGTVHSTAAALFGNVYAPVPLPYLDLFGKLGVARLHIDVRGEIPGLLCPANFPNCGSVAASSSTTRFAYGAGLQLKFAAVAVRAEFERIEASTGAPDMLSLGVTWRF